METHETTSWLYSNTWILKEGRQKGEVTTPACQYETMMYVYGLRVGCRKCRYARRSFRFKQWNFRADAPWHGYLAIGPSGHLGR